jgi:hypothetical protein
MMLMPEQLLGKRVRALGRGRICPRAICARAMDLGVSA